MHNHLTRILILMGTFILLFAGLSPQTLQATTPLVINQGALIHPAKAQTAIMPDIRSARPTEAAAFVANYPEKVISPTQHLGELDTLAWDDLATANPDTTYAQLLVLPPYDEYRFQLGDDENIYFATKNSEVKESFPDEVNPVNKIYLSKTQHTELGISCAACHAIPQPFNEKPGVNNIGHMIQLQGDSETSIACEQCHLQKIKQVSWQFRGVE